MADKTYLQNLIDAITRTKGPVQPQPLSPDDEAKFAQSPSVMDAPADAFRKRLGQTVEQGTSVGLGALGVGADSKANRFGQLLSAAIPFPIGAKAFHGALDLPQAFEQAQVDAKPGDYLRRLVNFSEDPRWAEMFQRGAGRYKTVEDAQAAGHQPGILPAQLDVKQALNLQGPDPADMQQLFRTYRKNYPGADPELASQTLEQANKLRTGGISPEEAADHAQLLISRSPGLLDKAGFDGVAYHDGAPRMDPSQPMNPAWAVEQTNRITPGAPLQPSGFAQELAQFLARYK